MDRVRWRRCGRLAGPLLACQVADLAAGGSVPDADVLVGMNPGSQWRNKAWPPERYAALAASIADGFGGDSQGDDRFDAAVGLIGMINVLCGNRDPGDPRDCLRRTVEGWILGQSPD